MRLESSSEWPFCNASKSVSLILSRLYITGVKLWMEYFLDVSLVVSLDIKVLKEPIIADFPFVMGGGFVYKTLSTGFGTKLLVVRSNGLA